MQRLAKIIRLAAYIDKNGKMNTDIPQNISQEIYNYKNAACELQYKITINNPYYKATHDLIYKIYNNIGIYGNKLKNNSNNDEIIIECQLGMLTNESIIKACQILDNELNKPKYLSPDIQQELTDKFEDYLYNNYYLLAIIVYKNREHQKQKFKFLNKAYTIEQIRNKYIHIVDKYILQYT